MKIAGFTMLLIAIAISAVMTANFGLSFFQELSTWLMIVIGLFVVGLGLITEREQEARNQA